MLRFTSAGRSHEGLVRDHNEDSGFAGPYLQLVADGVGGSAAGEVASATAAYVVSALAGAQWGSDPAELLTRAVSLAYEQLRRGSESDRSRTGMGTTFTALLIDDDRCALGHLGDSRAYLLRDGELSQLTHDHTYVQSLVDSGVITREQARTHPRKNVVVRALETTGTPQPDVLQLEIGVGDRFLVCSDGLSDLVEDDVIAACLGEQDPEAAAERLVEAALAAGGTDNVTAVVSDVIDGPRIVFDGARLGAFGNPYLIVDPAAVRAPA
jgi:protein phosphatase